MKYLVTLNGTQYEVDLADGHASIGGSQPAAVSAQPVSAAPAAATVPAPGGGQPVNAPMPGTILSVAVQTGSAVKAGQLLCTLEAMKMENEIVSPCDGIVTQVNVARGQNVESGALLMTIA